MSTRPIVLSAAYGMGNIGDEAICDTCIADIRSLEPDARIAVLAWDPALWRKAHPGHAGDPRIDVCQCFFVPSQWKSPRALASALRTVGVIARCRLFVWGGGGIVRDRRYWLRAYLSNLRVALLFRRPVLVLTIGVDRIRDDVVKKMVSVLKYATSIIVRDGESARNLAEAFGGDSVAIGIVRDPVFHYPEAQRIASKERVVALNLCHKDGANAIDDDFRSFAARAAEALSLLHARHPIVLKGLPTDPRDASFIRYVASLVPSIPFSLEECVAPSEYVDALRGCSLLLGMRMHGIILGSRVKGLPIAVFRYSAKTEELFVSSGKTDRLFPFDSFDPAQVADSCLALLKKENDEPLFAAFAADSRAITDALSARLR